MMKKRIVCLVLFLLMLLFPAFALQTNAATTLNYPPYTKVEYGYSANVSCGTIRYIAQNRSSEHFSWNYWPTNSFGGYTGGPEIECGTACISMSLSYVGVNRTPKALLEATNGFTGNMWVQQDSATPKAITKSASAISSAMDDYINGNGKYSPLCVYIVPFSATSSMHWVLLVGKIGSNKYLALNPWHTSGTNATFTIQINGSTATYNGTTNPISSVNQWYNPNASIQGNTPGKPVLNHSISGKKVAFSWSATQNTTHYNLWIDKKDSAGKWVVEEQIFYAESGVSRTLEPGEYRAQLLSYNSDAWEPDGSDWLHTWAEDVFFTIKDDYTIRYYDSSGNVWRTGKYAIGDKIVIPSDYPKASGKYFSGWAYEAGASSFHLRPGDEIRAAKNLNLYPVYVTHSQAISGNAVFIYNIKDFDKTGYTIAEVPTTIQVTVDASYWTDWSKYTTDAVTPSATVEVRTTTLYRYYYYLCPSCGAHEPFWGKSDCGASIPSNAWHVEWFTTPYTQSNYQSFSYTTKKYYTTSLGDGQLWVFSSGNLSDTTPGTMDADGDTEVIATGYSKREFVPKTTTVSKTVTAYKITVSHTHSYGGWVKMNDTYHKQTCTCGDVRTEKHSWDSGRITTIATCDREGVKTYTCQTCKATKTEKLSKTAHTYSNSCDTTCNGCGAARTVTHSYAEQWFGDRNSHWHKCTICGHVNATAKHTESDWIVDQEPGEWSAGFKHTKCTICSMTVQTVSIPATGCNHADGTKLVGEKNSTCDAEGYTGDQVCKICNTVLSSGTWIPATGHESEIHHAKNASCTEPGYTGDEICMICSVTVKMGDVIPVLNHNYADGYCTACGTADPNAMEGSKPMPPNVDSSVPTESESISLEQNKPAQSEIADNGHLILWAAVIFLFAVIIAAGVAFWIVRKKSLNGKD